jgi:dienelactone hydrolase
MEIYIYLPKDSKPPYQTIIFFPGSGDIFSKKYNPDAINGRTDFILKSGRVLVYPIYKGTHERHDDLKSDLPEETVFYKDHVIMWRKDIGRTIDYLESRTDIQANKIGYLGWSWGGFLGGIMPAVEKRIKAVVLNVGGMEMHKALPEADQINFLPRVRQPVLMLNGKHDMYFPVETSQKPMFALLGADKKDKKIIVYESGHLVPRTEFVKETLTWFDRYLGPVK